MNFGEHCGIRGCTAKHKPTLYGAEGECSMNATTVKNRVQKMRAERDALGLKRLELYAHPEDWPAIQALAKKLARKRAKMLAAPRAWMCEFSQEDGGTRTQFVEEDPAGLRWNDAGEPSPYRTTPLYEARKSV